MHGGEVLGEIDIDSDNAAAFGADRSRSARGGRGAAAGCGSPRARRNPDDTPITLIPGDGIGPEVTEAVVRILEAAGLDIEWEPSRRRRAGAQAARHDAADRAARVDQAQQGRAEGAGDDADRRGLHERQRRPAQGARSLRQPAAGVEPAGVPSRYPGRRPRHRPREHRGSLLRARARGRARRRREPEDHHASGVERGSRSSRSTTRGGTAASASRPCTRRTS